MKRICLFPILAFFCLTACNDLNSIVVLPGTVYAPVEGGEYELSVVTNNRWETSCNVKWLKLSQTSGYGDATIHLTVKPNTTYKTSAYYLPFSDGKNTVQVIVTREAMQGKIPDDVPQQNPNAPIEVSPMNISCPSDGGSFEVQIMSTEKWTVNPQVSWITSNIGMGKGNGKIILTVAPATSYETTKSWVTIKPLEAVAEEEYTYIIITRAGK